MACGSTGPIEAKVYAATGGAAAATVVVWCLQTFAGVQVPPLVELAIQALLIALATFIAGWAARHTPRTDPAATGRHHWRE
jgi:hypothetical protein